MEEKNPFEIWKDEIAGRDLKAEQFLTFLVGFLRWFMTTPCFRCPVFRMVTKIGILAVINAVGMIGFAVYVWTR